MDPVREGARVELEQDGLGCSRLSAIEIVFPACLCLHLREKEGSRVPRFEPKALKAKSFRRLLEE